ncbi:MAG: hypothetical protein JKP92_07010 [Alphaproteobacteria bacterium]|jgi:hypothetical protein|nr:hypothetical protein [Alphaproteobacteria bacterium]
MSDTDNIAALDAAGPDNDVREKQADILLRLAGGAELFHAPDGTPYADVTDTGVRRTLPVRGRAFRDWLGLRFYQETGSAPNREAMTAALRVLEAKARYEGPERPVAVRVAGHGGKIYIDLGTPDWRAVEVDARGWRVVDTPPVRFRRPAGLKPLPVPVRGGDIRGLRRFLNLRTKEDFILTLAWLQAALRPEGPYPILALTGEQGSAKSTFALILRALVDPSQAPLRNLPREDRDAFIAASNGHVLVFDNLSGVPPWISDTLCRLATGGGFATRQLYTDQDEAIFQAARPIILNGIADVVARPDLADRAVMLTLEPIPDAKRRPEKALWADINAALPGLFGGLLDTIAHGLRALPHVHLTATPRMADFAHWATACEGAVWAPGTFMAAYGAERAASVDSVIEGDPVASAVRGFMQGREAWEGTATDLLALLSVQVGETVQRLPAWPKAPNALSGRLTRAATFLRKAGVEMATGARAQGRGRARRITLTRRADNACAPSSAPSEASERPQTQGPAANDGRTQGRTTVRTTVQEKNMFINALTDADDADAHIPALSGARVFRTEATL